VPVPFRSNPNGVLASWLNAFSWRQPVALVLTVATGLVFAGDELCEENRTYLAKVEEQVASSEELSRMVQGLEERYDSYMAGSTLATPMIHTGDLPSADELAAELERFLANRPTGDDEKRGA
jgi:hypothetical protein